MAAIYLLIAFVAGVAELFTGTFYLAAVALAALITLGASAIVPSALLHWVFLLACLFTIPATMVLRHRLARKATGIDDMDLGQTVAVLAGPDAQQRYRVQYRGSEWMAELESGSACPGDRAVIVGKEGNILKLAVSDPPLQEPLCPPH
ncbi:MAG: NfeD family protein [Acidithiobacillus sp.]|uniref:NfeD family protein n=1 Tax=Acidithiobacillus sp. TaxID=1872118 RepID=UPI003D0394AF